eukprot:gene15111-16667_t
MAEESDIELSQETLNYLANVTDTCTNIQTSSNGNDHCEDLITDGLPSIVDLPSCPYSLRNNNPPGLIEPRQSFVMASSMFPEIVAPNFDDFPQRPSSQAYPGNFRFHVEIKNTTEKITKAMPWTFSEKLDIVFCNVNTAVPFHFKYSEDLPRTSFIRAFVMAKRDDTFAVKNCPGHAALANKNKNHFLKTGNKSVVYGQCSQTGILSIRFPAAEYQDGLDYFLENISFNCFCSCHGKSNRELMIFFTLEDGKRVLGRAAMGLKVCACPGRDRQDAEKKASPSKKRKMAEMLKGFSESDSDNKIYLLSIVGKRYYKNLAEINKGYQILRDGKERDLPCGELVPLERTASGGVAKWLINDVEAISRKAYPDKVINT